MTQIYNTSLILPNICDNKIEFLTQNRCHDICALNVEFKYSVIDFFV